MLAVHMIKKSMRVIGIGYLIMNKLKRKMLKIYHKILKASVKKKFDKADDLNWKLLQLEIKIRELEKSDQEQG